MNQLIEERPASSSDYLVDVVIKPGNLMVVEADSDEAVSINDCTGLGRYLKEHLGRDIENYEPEIDSTGIASPLKVLHQHIRNIGNEVEALLKNSSKLTGVLKSADENDMVIPVRKKMKPEGIRREVTVVEGELHTFGEIRYTKHLIRFR